MVGSQQLYSKVIIVTINLKGENIVTSNLKGEKFRADDIKSRKYLIIWSLDLGRQELEKISMKPESLMKGLDYVNTMKEGSELKIYRIIHIDEIISYDSRPLSGETSPYKNPNGIAIVDGNSIEEVRKMVDTWVDGLRYGGISIQRYLKYEIKPLLELGRNLRDR